MSQIEEIRVLVIEDDALDYEFVRRSLKASTRRRFLTRHATTLFQSYGYLASTRADVVLLDLGLQETSGLDTLRSFQEHVPGMPVIVLSGEDQLDIAIEALAEGALDYLVKGDISEPILSRALCYALERKRLQQRLDDAELRAGPMLEKIAVCTDCKSVRDDLGFWGQLTEFLGAYTDTTVEETCCPKCEAEMEQNRAA